jgi:hypothetical protein
MSKKRQELPGMIGNGLTSKKVVQQGLTPIYRNFQEPQIGNPLASWHMDVLPVDFVT